MHKPFSILEQWVQQGRIHLAPSIAMPVVDVFLGSEETADPEIRDFPMEALPAELADNQLFDFAMRDVKSLGWSAVPLIDRPPIELQGQDDEREALRLLEDFVRNGNIDIEQTAEYIERSVQPHGRLYLDDLRAGRFSIQAHLDLHGLSLADARFALDEFILASVRAGLSCVRVIHGRGRHSFRHHPVLKENIQRWLVTRRMSRHVIAFSSARMCDGGGGAVYVLLRK
jgi:DNA-nicking Smr family endonuclease